MEIKEVKFKTNKGEFILIDMIGQTRRFIPWDFVEKSYNVKGINEEEASEIIDDATFIFTPGEMIEYNYLYKDYESNKLSWTLNEKDSLMSLVKSLGGDDYTNPVILKLE